MRRIFYFGSVLFLLASFAYGDRGELYLDIGTKPGWLWAQNPLVETSKYQSGFFEDFSVGARYGLGDNLHIGLAVLLASSFLGLSSSNARVKSVTGNLNSSILTLYVPVLISYRVNTGYDWAPVIEVAFGYFGVQWTNNSLNNKNNLLFAQEDLEQPWQNGMAGSVSILTQGRLNDWLALEIGPSLNVVYLEGRRLAFFPGLALRASFIFGIGGGL